MSTMLVLFLALNVASGLVQSIFYADNHEPTHLAIAALNFAVAVWMTFVLVKG